MSTHSADIPTSTTPVKLQSNLSSTFSRTSSTESRDGEGGEGREVGTGGGGGGEGKDLTPIKSWLKKHLDSVNPDFHDTQQQPQLIQQLVVHSQLLKEPKQLSKPVYIIPQVKLWKILIENKDPEMSYLL